MFAIWARAANSKIVERVPHQSSQKSGSTKRLSTNTLDFFFFLVQGGSRTKDQGPFLRSAGFVDKHIFWVGQHNARVKWSEAAAEISANLVAKQINLV